MQEVLNHLNSVNPVPKLQLAVAKPSSSPNKSLAHQPVVKQNTQNTAKSQDSNLTNNDTDVDNNSNNFNQALADKTHATKNADSETGIDKDKVKELSQELIAALMAFLQQAQPSQAIQNAEPLNGGDMVASSDLQLPTLDSLSADLAFELPTDLVSDASNSLNLVSTKLGELIDSNLPDNNSTAMNSLLEQVLNSEELTNASPDLKLALVSEINSAFSDELASLQKDLSKQIEAIDLDDIALSQNNSVQNLSPDNASDIALSKVSLEAALPKLSPELEVQLETVIKLGEKLEQVTQLQNLSNDLGKELEKQINNSQGLASNLQLGEQVEKCIKTEMTKLLGAFNAELRSDTALAEGEETSTSDLEALSDTPLMDHAFINVDSHSDDKGFTFHKEMGVEMRKTPEHINTVMKAAELIKALPDMARETNPNSTRELKIKLNPEELGTVDVTITRNSKQQISIELSVANDSAEKVLKHKLNELSSSLGEKGISVNDINISKSESGGMNDKNSEGRNAFNEGKEEQKKRQEQGQQSQRNLTKDKYAFQSELLSILR